MKEHPKAEILRAIADGKEIQILKGANFWVDATLLCIVSYPNDTFRIKPETININGHEVPAPVREPLEDGQAYWVVNPIDDELANSWW